MYQYFVLLTTITLALCDIDLKLNGKQAGLGEHLIYKEIGQNLDKFRVDLQLSLSKSDGMVFYAVDNSKEQYVVSLKKKYYNEDILSIEVNSGYNELLLEDICGWRQIEFRRFKLTIVIDGEMIGVACDDGRMSFIKRNNYKKNIDESYPMIEDSTKAARHFYFINVPGDDKSTLSNLKQLEGCLHKIELDTKEIRPTIITYKKSRSLDNDNFKKCKETCHKNSCKAQYAECLEYFDKNIQKCSCFKSEMNGNLCDQALQLKKKYVYSLEEDINYFIDRIKFSLNITKLNMTHLHEDLYLLKLYKTWGRSMNVTVKLSSSLNQLTVKLNNGDDLNFGIGYNKFKYGVSNINLQFYTTFVILQMVHGGEVVLDHKINHDRRTSDLQFNRIFVNSSYFDCDFLMSSSSYSYNMKPLRNWKKTEFKSEYRKENFNNTDNPSASRQFKKHPNESISLASTDAMAIIIISVLATILVVISGLLIAMVFRNRKKKKYIQISQRATVKSTHLMLQQNNL